MRRWVRQLIVAEVLTKAGDKEQVARVVVNITAATRSDLIDALIRLSKTEESYDEEVD